MNPVGSDVLQRDGVTWNRQIYLQDAKERKNRLLKRWNAFIFLVFFLIIVVARFPMFNQMINKVAAPVFSAVFVFQFRHLLRKLPAEYFLFAGFLVWSLSGYPVALEKGYYIEYFTLIFQIFILMLVVVAHAKLQKNLAVFHSVYMINALVFFLTSIFTGEVTSLRPGDVSGRVFGLIVSPNGYGYIMLLAGVSALLNMARKRHRTGLNLFYLMVTAVATLGIIWSGSRKAFLGWVIFACIWVMMNLGANILRNIFAGVGVLMISLALWFGVQYILEETIMGERFHKLEREDSVLGRNRAILYRESVEVFKDHPLVGVGLSNFQVYSKLGGYTHSDYMEVLTNTGIPGLILYLGLYVVIINRLLKSIRFALYRQQMIHTLNMLSFLLIYLMMGFGRPNFNSIFSMSYMAIISMESVLLKQNIARHWTLRRRQAINAKRRET